MAGNGNGKSGGTGGAIITIVISAICSGVSIIGTHLYENRHRDNQLHQLQTTAAYTKLQDKLDAFERGMSSAVLTFQIALENPQNKNFQKNVPESIAVVTEEIKEVDRARASLKIDPEIRTELDPVLLVTGTDLAAIKSDPHKARQLIDHYHNSNAAVINDVRNKIEEKLKQLPALDTGTPIPAKTDQ